MPPGKYPVGTRRNECAIFIFTEKGEIYVIAVLARIPERWLQADREPRSRGTGHRDPEVVTVWSTPHRARFGLVCSPQDPYRTTCVTTVDVLPEKVALTAYTALTLCLPLLSVDMLKVALPLPSRVPVPRVVPSSLKLTVPVGVTPVDEVTLAVNVTNCPTPDGFGAE